MGRAYKYVVLGGGNSAGYAASEFVEYGVPPGDLCIVSQEAVAPYERPALSKGYLLAEGGGVQLPAFHTCVGAGRERQTPKWYQDHGIELLLSTRIVTADVKQKTLTTASGESLSYQTLIVATGARVLRLEDFGVVGSVCGRICYLRDLEDADRLVETMAACKGGKAVVIGGGYIGMEVAAALTNNSISTTMVFPENHCMARLFTPEIASFYENVYRTKGVTFVKGTVVESFEGRPSGDVGVVVLKDGRRLEADMVVVGIGIRGNTDLFNHQLGIEQEGLRVNGSLRTTNPSVYAIGDVASFPLPMLGGAVQRVEHVDHARRSAAHCVASIMGGGAAGEYDYLPYFYSRVFSLSWQFYGSNVGECVLFGDPARGKFGAYWVKDGVVMGAFLEGGSQSEYAALAYAARSQPKVGDTRALASLGVGFAVDLAEEMADVGGGVSSRSRLLVFTSPSSRLAMQAGVGVMLAVVIVGVAYWHGRRKRKW